MTSTEIIEAILEAYTPLKDALKKAGLSADEIGREDLMLLATAYNASSISNMRDEISDLSEEMYLLRRSSRYQIRLFREDFRDQIRLFREDLRPILKAAAGKIKES